MEQKGYIMAVDSFDLKRKMCRGNDTRRIYDNYIRRLYGIAIRAFKWYNLPPSLPQNEIELRLIWQGFAPIFNHPKYGIVTSYGSLYGVNIYNHANHALYSQPTLGNGEFSIGIGGAVVYNTSWDMNGGSVMRDIIEWYARFLTDIDVSMNIAIVNGRGTRGIMAKTEQAKKALEDYYRKLQQGEYAVPFSNAGLLDDFQQLLMHNINDNLSIDSMQELKIQTVRTFYNMYGIQMVDHKKERLITDEVETDIDYINSNIADMLTMRQNGAEMINKVLGTEIVVEKG